MPGEDDDLGTPKKLEFTQEQLDKIILDRMKARDREIEGLKTELKDRPSSDDLKAIQAQLESMKDEKEMENKTGLEKLEHQYSKEVEKRERAINELKANLDAATKGLTDAQSTLQGERISRTLGDALDKNKVFSGARRDALHALISEVSDVEQADDGSFTASWGEMIDAGANEIAEAFLKTRAHFAEAPSGGAGTRRSTGGGMPTDLSALSDEQLLELDAQTHR